VLTKEQLQLLPILKRFSPDYYMVGGTAIALYLGHRRSIDFDLFTTQKINREHIAKIIKQHNYPVKDILYEDHEQLHIIVNSVKMTFFSFPHKIYAPQNFEDIINLPSLLDLGAMKAYALGGRAKWKDYVDLYFIFKNHFGLQKISQRAKEIFSSFFNEKLFREQLCYYEDIDYSESIEYLASEIRDEEIKKFLTQIALTPF
jgi:hypothetical protein